MPYLGLSQRLLALGLFLPWRNGYYCIGFFSLTVVKTRDCKSETNLAIGEENQVLEVALDVFLQS